MDNATKRVLLILAGMAALLVFEPPWGFMLAGLLITFSIVVSARRE